MQKTPLRFDCAGGWGKEYMLIIAAFGCLEPFGFSYVINSFYGFFLLLDLFFDHVWAEWVFGTQNSRQKKSHNPERLKTLPASSSDKLSGPRHFTDLRKTLLIGDKLAK
jgi:hypothetical protein